MWVYSQTGKGLFIPYPEQFSLKLLWEKTEVETLLMCLSTHLSSIWSGCQHPCCVSYTRLSVWLWSLWFFQNLIKEQRAMTSFVIWREHCLSFTRAERDWKIECQYCVNSCTESISFLICGFFSSVTSFSFVQSHPVK